MFASLEGKRGEGFERKKEQVEEIEDNGRRGFWGLLFLFKIQNAPYLQELKNCIDRGFWGILEGSYDFFKFNLCCYNILKIKNILRLDYNSPKNHSLTKYERFF